MAEVFGRYRLDDRLGQGGMGIVYRAFDTVLERTVAVKMILGPGELDASMRERFFREARAAAHLAHKNVVTIYDLGEHDGRAYLAMEFLEGEDLQHRLSRPDKIAYWRKVEIALEICQGVEFAHAHGVIHRDLKPANIFITTNGGVKILDFGLARQTASELTHSNMMMGTLNYMSPEQVRGERADQQSDVFALGVVLYELFGQRRAFDGDSAASTLYKILQEPPEPLWKIDAGLPPELAAVIDRALAKQRQERYPDVAALRRDLEIVRDLSHAPGAVTPRVGLSAGPLTPHSGPTQLLTVATIPSPVPVSGPGSAALPSTAPVPSTRAAATRGFAAGAAIVVILTLGAAVLWLARRGSEAAPPAGTVAKSTEAPVGASSAPPAEKPAAPAPAAESSRPAIQPAPRPRPSEPPNTRVPQPAPLAQPAPRSTPEQQVPDRTAPEAKGGPAVAVVPSAVPAIQAAPAALGSVPAAVTAPAPPTAVGPARPAPPASVDGPPAAVDSVNDLLRRYRQALEDRSLEQLKRIWPSLAGAPEAAMRREFQQASTISVEISDPQVTLSAATGRVAFSRRYSLRTVDGQLLQNTTQTLMDVRRSGDTWVIEAIRFVPR